MKKLLFPYFVFLVTLSINIYGQVDGGDTVLVNKRNRAALNSLRDQNLNRHYQSHDSVSRLMQQTLQLASKLHFNKGIGDSHANLGYYNRFIRGDYKMAIIHFNKAAVFHHLSHDVNAEGLDFSHIGFIMESEGKSQSAIMYFLKAEAAFQEMNLPSSGFPSLGIGAIYAKRGNYARAEEFMLNALKKCKKNGNQTALLNTYISLIELFLDRDYKRATQYWNEAQKTFANGQPFPYYYNKMLKITEAKMLMVKNDYRSAEIILRKADSVANALIDEDLYAVIHKELGRAMAAQGNLMEAEFYYRKSFDEANHAKEQSLAMENARQLSMILRKQKRWNEALDFSSLGLMWADSLNKRNLAALASDMEEQIEYVRQEKENKILKMSLAMAEDNVIRQQLIIAGCVIVFLLSTGIVFILVRSRRNINRKNKLLQKQYQESKAQNEEIRSQHEVISAQAEELRVEGDYLANQNEKLNELNYEKDALVSIVAHDLRAPFNQTKGLAKILRHTTLTEEQISLTDLLTKVSDQALVLIKDILQVNAIDYQPVELESVNLHHLIHETLLPSIQEQATKKQISFYPSVDNELTILSHPLSLKRILENLVSNAIKFSVHGTSVFLRVMSSDDWVYISIQDQGPGISEADQKKMFKKFQRLSAKPTSGESSTGLGLAIVKGLVEKLHGVIEVKSEMNVGTEFIVRLHITGQQRFVQRLKVSQ